MTTNENKFYPPKGSYKRDLQKLLSYLDKGYVLISAEHKLGASKYTLLLSDGYDVAFIHPSKLESTRPPEKADNSRLKKADK